MENLNKIREFLALHPRSSAKIISKTLGLTKTEVNSILYSGKEEFFKRYENSPPLWENKKNSRNKLESLKELHNLPYGDIEFHIDSYGQKRVLKIVIVNQSRNDPYVFIEKKSPFERIIIVSAALLKDEEIEKLKVLPDSILVAAASIVSWEISQLFRNADNDSFEFGQAMTDIFLSLASQNDFKEISP